MAAQSFPGTITAVGACDAVRREVTALAGENAPFNLGRETGALDYVTNSGGGAGIEYDIISSSDAVVKRARVLYDQRTRPCQVSTDPNTNICNDTGTTISRKEFFVDIDKKLSSPARYWTVEDMAVLCDPGKAEFMRQRLANDLRATRERWDEILLAEFNARVGKIYHWDGTTTAAGSYKSLQLLDNNSTGSPDQDIPLPGNYVNMLLDYENMQLGGVPAIIGQGYFHKFMMLQKMSCCNATTPYGEAVAGAGAAYYFDQAGNAVLGANKVVMATPGAIHLMTYNVNNIININTELEAHTVVRDPVYPNIYWNLDFKWDCTTNRWKYMYSIHWTLFNVFQTDSFGTDSGTPDCGDELYGMNGLFGYQITRG
jgi:hypothetical protein